MAVVGKRLLVILPMILLSVVAAWVVTNVFGSKTTFNDRVMAPNFGLAELSGKRFYLSDHREDRVFVVFWQTSCSVCKEEMIYLNQLLETGTGNVAVAVCTDPQNGELIRQIGASLNIRYPILLDIDGRVRRKYGVENFPTTIVVGPGGYVEFRREGYDEHVKRRLGMLARGAAR